MSARLRPAAGAVLTGVLLLGGLLLGGPAAGAAEAPVADTGDLIQVSPAVVEVVAPAPGHATTWTVSVSDTPATAGSAVPLWLAVTGTDGPLLHGDHPLRLTVTAEDGTEVLASDDPAALLGRSVALADLRGTTTLTVVAELPEAAGDEYRGATGSVRLAVTAEAPDPDVPAPGGFRSAVLAVTGAEPAALLLAVAALLGMGGSALAARRRAAARVPAPARTGLAWTDPGGPDPARTVHPHPARPARPEEDR